jgi:hypothetical protein
MTELTSRQIAEYFRRSYTAADGLWFMKVEEKYGFDVALEVDGEVWKVLPKIQARLIKQFLELEEGPEALLEALTVRLKMEGFTFTTEKSTNGFRISVTDCPWHNMMIKSGREHLAEQVGTKVCTTEYQVWASELAKNMKFALKSHKCGKADCCVLEFVG